MPGDELGPAGGRFRLPVACLTGVMLAMGVVFVVLRVVTPVVYVMGWAGLVAFATLFPSPGRRRAGTAGCCRRCAPPRSCL